jgi:AcrR family transcriptional regulator
MTALRDVARTAVREEVLRHAWRLFAEQGFEATTIDQVAGAAGMSRRTFFRYFSGKDELIVARMIEAGERVAEALAARPAEEPAWPALRAAFDAIVRIQDEKSGPSRTLQRLLRDEPGVRASLEERRRYWVALLTPLVGPRLPAGVSPDLRAQAVVSAAIACLDLTQEIWSDTGDETLGALLDRAMAAVAPLT